MDDQFGRCVLRILKKSLDHATVRQFLQDLFFSVQASSKESVNKVLEYYRKHFVRNGNDIRSWSHLEMFASIMCELPSAEEKQEYMDQCLSLIDKEDIDEVHHTAARQESSYGLRVPVESVYAESFENLEKISDRRSIASYGANTWQQGTVDTTLHSLSDPYFSTMVRKTDIIQAIPYLVIGAPSTLFELKERSFIIPTNIPNGESQQLHDIIEAGILYLHIHIKVESLKKNCSSNTLKMAFLTFIQSKLREYNNFVNAFSSNLNPQDHLSYVYQNLYPEILKLRVYLSLLEQFDGIRSNQLLGLFQSRVHNGDPMMEKLFSEALTHMIQPYMDNIFSWLTKGRLVNSWMDFFVQGNEAESSPFTFVPNDVPKFLPMLVARRIFIVGTSIRYLEQFCQDIDWVKQFSNKYSLQYKLMGSFAENPALFDVIEKQYTEANNRIKQLLEDQFYFFDTIELLKDSLLMGKSDFIESIIQNSESVLSQPSQLLQSHHLTQCIQTAIRGSSLRNRLNKSDNNLLLSRLDARLLELSHGTLGWDVFTLDYLVDEPLHTVIDINDAGSRKEYLRIFNFLWRIKKNEYLFQQEWQRNSSLLKLFRKMNLKIPLMRDVMSKLALINTTKNQIQSFTKKVELFVFENIIDREFQEFLLKLHEKDEDTLLSVKVKTLKNGVKVANGILKPDCSFTDKPKENPSDEVKHVSSYDVEELKRMHSEFLARILNHPLLYSGPGASIGVYTSQSYPTTLVLLLDLSHEFVINYSELNNILHEICIQINLDPTQSLHDTTLRFNTLLQKLVNQWKEFDNECNAYIKDLKRDQSTELNRLSRILH